MAEKEEKTFPKSTFMTARLLIIVVGVVLLAALGSSLYFYKQYQKTQQLLQNPTLAAKIQEKALLDQVGKLMVLPTGEDPQIATVSDVTKLQDQPFFAHAVNGDKVLIYTKARIAILYDPIANKIINVAPVNLGNNTPVSPIPTATPTPVSKKVVPHVTVTQ